MRLNGLPLVSLLVRGGAGPPEDLGGCHGSSSSGRSRRKQRPMRHLPAPHLKLLGAAGRGFHSMSFLGPRSPSADPGPLGHDASGMRMEERGPGRPSNSVLFLREHSCLCGHVGPSAYVNAASLLPVLQNVGREAFSERWVIPHPHHSGPHFKEHTENQSRPRSIST